MNELDIVRDNQMAAENNVFGLVVVAAGRGERAGSPEEGPKQYRPIGGKPVISHSLNKFVLNKAITNIVIVIHPDDHEFIQRALNDVVETSKITILNGGTTRQQSVQAGLEALIDTHISHVMIHDAVRPFVSQAIIERIINAHEEGKQAALPVIAVNDTIKRALNNQVITTVDRRQLYAAQTPQSFDYKQILNAHRAAAKTTDVSFTDDASIAEWAGITVTTVEGSVDNIKLTLKRDISMADERLTNFIPDVRTGNGYDVHQLEAGDGVTLCGVFIPHDQRLKGHSDADVALHALTDALLATCGAGDIGDHFPPSDMQWKGAKSTIFLEHAAKIVRAAGGTIMNADVSLIAEAPKVGPHRLAMRQVLSQTLGISLDRCSVKATTNEMIGFVGRREGIAAIATATVIYNSK